MSDSLQSLLREVASVQAGQSRAAARLMSLVADQPEITPEVLVGLYTAPQHRLLLGITGPPGVGKSTLTDALVAEFRARGPARRIGVIAVDPSSPFSGGAILGDRVRMMRHASDPNIFIRSLAARGRLGGLAGGIAATVRIMGALESDIVVIETVGVGQSEMDVRNIADLVAVVLAPGFGDEIQLLKAGLLEIADFFVVNKADRPGAAELQSALTSAMPQQTAFLVSATKNTGVPELVHHLEGLTETNQTDWVSQRSEKTDLIIRQALVERAGNRLRGIAEANGLVCDLLGRVVQGRQSFDDAVQELLIQAASSAAD